jgi:hypothetical protein
MITALRIVDFTSAHVERASQIALQNFREGRRSVPALPSVEAVPNLMPFSENGLGVAAFDGDTMLGFLCGRGVWENAWGIQGLRNVFSPMHGNGAVFENRSKIYARLYQAAGEKWAEAGAASHSICLYAHDKQAQKQFYRYGFGMRCVDAIRGTDEIKTPDCAGYEFSELSTENALDVLPLEKKLDAGFIDSPFFMYREQISETDFLKEYERSESVYFVAKYNGETIAFIRAERGGETFIHDTPGYLHCKGLYCLPEHRDKRNQSKSLVVIGAKIESTGIYPARS